MMRGETFIVETDTTRLIQCFHYDYTRKDLSFDYCISNLSKVFVFLYAIFYSNELHYRLKRAKLV